MDSWLAALRGRLPRHAELIDALLEVCRADERIRVLELQASLARGAGDELSDLDLGVAVRDDEWERVADELPDRLRRIAPTVDLLSHTIPEWGTRPHRRLFVQYADGRQIDLVVQPAASVTGRISGAIVLYDPDDRMADERVVSVATATAADVRAWEVLGWESLANVAKYLERGSAWEALNRLRRVTWRCSCGRSAKTYPTRSSASPACSTRIRHASRPVSKRLPHVRSSASSQRPRARAPSFFATPANERGHVWATSGLRAPCPPG